MLVVFVSLVDVAVVVAKTGQEVTVLGQTRKKEL